VKLKKNVEKIIWENGGLAEFTNVFVVHPRDLG
jgi:hypothetical protein